MLPTPRRLLPAAVTALAVLAGPAAAVAASGPLVDVRAVSTTKDVIRPSLTGTAQAYTDDTGVAHPLAGPTALGALLTAANAQGRTVTGTYFPSISDLFVTRIAGVGPPSASGFWSFFLNGVPAETGAGSTPVKRGDAVAFLLENGKKETLVLDLAVRKVGKRAITFRVETIGGKAPVPTRGASVVVGRQTFRTNAKGLAVVPVTKTKITTAYATRKGAVRSQTLLSFSAR
jgi:hypothetical protein